MHLQFFLRSFIPSSFIFSHLKMFLVIFVMFFYIFVEFSFKASYSATGTFIKAIPLVTAAILRTSYSSGAVGIVMF